MVGLYDDVISIIDDWDSKDYPNETAYRDDLLKFLRNELNKPNALGTQPERINLAKEDGRGLCDIAIDGRIGIELKKDLLGKSEIDRLIGQVLHYKKQYEDIIIVLVGALTDDALDQLEASLDDVKDNEGITLGENVSIEVIDKAYEVEEGDEDSNAEDDTKGDNTDEGEEEDNNDDPTGVNKMAENFKKNSRDYGKY